MKFNKLFIVFILVSLVLCGCSDNKANVVGNNSQMSENTEINKYDTENKYIYINGYATFSQQYKDGYVIFSDHDYVNGEPYYGKARWKMEDNQTEILSAFQVISANDKEIYSEALKIEDLRNESGNNKTWDFMVQYKPLVKVKCDNDSEIQYYIKLIDKKNVEYHMMLVPVAGYNTDEFSGAAVYIVDPENNENFLYDDYIIQSDKEDK